MQSNGIVSMLKCRLGTR